MNPTAREEYLATEVLTAAPQKLQLMLIEAAIRFGRRAELHWQSRENEAAFNTVVRLGCAIGQGWYFGKPMPADQARELLAARHRIDEPPLSSAING